MDTALGPPPRRANRGRPLVRSAVRCIVPLALWGGAAPSARAQQQEDPRPIRPFTLTLAALPDGPPATMREADVVVDGVRIHYAEGGTGPPVVFCHGWTMNHRAWFRNLAPLARVAHVYAIDWPGFGLSDKPAAASYDPAWQTALLADFLDALGLQRVHLVGHSMGGHWTTYFLLQYPDRVDRYVGVASAAMLPGPAIYRNPVPRFFTRQYFQRLAAARDAGQAQVAFWQRNLRGSEPITPEFLAAVSDFDTRGDPASVPITLAAVEGMLATPLRSRVHAIETPTLLVWGDRDWTVHLRYGKMLARAMPNAQLLILPGVGHVPMLQAADSFNRAVAQFLRLDANRVSPSQAAAPQRTE